MSKEPSKKAIGAFVLGAVVLLVVGVLIFGTGKLFEKTYKFVLNFDESVKGLGKGAAVLFRGVEIGSVSDVMIRANPAKQSVQIAVIIEIEPGNFDVVGPAKLNPEKNIHRLIKEGLKARLNIASLVTGQLLVEIDYFPDKAVELTGTDLPYTEIPTIPTTIQEISEIVKELPVKKIFSQLQAAVGGINKVLGSPDLARLLRTTNLAMEDARGLIEGIDRKVDSLADTMDATLRDYRALARQIDPHIAPLLSGIDQTVKDLETLITHLDSRVDPAASSLEKTLKAARKALEKSKAVLSSANEMISEDSPQVYALENALEEFSSMANAIRSLADYLNRNPEALLRGKREAGGK